MSPPVPAPRGLAGVDGIWLDERAAIMEFEGGLSRAEADLRAAALASFANGMWKPYRERN
jgi:hypothetical protein